MIEFFEGFETCGTETSILQQAVTRPNIEKRWDDTDSGSFPEQDSFFLIDDDFGEGYAIRMGTNNFSNGNYLQWNCPEAKQEEPATREWIVGFRVHTPSTARTWDAVSIHGQFGGTTETEVITLEIENCTNINVNRATPSGFEIANADNVLTANNWFYIEFRFKIGESADGGLVEVRVDDTTVIAETIADTNNNVDIGFLYLRFNTTTASSGDDFVGYDDIYIMDTSEEPHTTYLGRVRVRSFPPNADVEAGWDNHTESDPNYSLVDENGVDTGDYVKTNVNNTRDRYRLTDLTQPDQVIAAKAEAEVQNTDGGEPSIFVEVNSGSSTASQEFVVDNTGDTELLQLLLQNNPDGSEWTPEAINALKAGYLFRNNLQ